MGKFWDCRLIPVMSKFLELEININIMLDEETTEETPEVEEVETPETPVETPEVAE